MDLHNNTSVFLLKSEEANNINKSKYEELLISNNYTVITINTLIFNYVNLDNLFSCLKNPEEYSGIFFASPRCVNAVKLTLDNNFAELDCRWKKLNNYVVGVQTYDIAMEKLCLECNGKESGNANILADLILRGEPHKKPLLAPHGNLKTNIFKERLLGHTKLHELLVYETNESPSIETDFREAINKLAAVPNYIVFFSPSGVNATLNCLTQQKDYEQIKLIAIGPTTALSMKEYGLNIFKVLDKPTPQNLLSVL